MPKNLNIMQQYADKDMVIIADGAAFGNEMADIVQQQELRPRKVGIFLPESFKWLYQTIIYKKEFKDR